MWKLASKSIKEDIRSNEEDVDSKQIKAPSDSLGDGRKTRKQEHLECPICWESFNVIENVPYVLWCGHTICKYCLLGLQRAIVIKSSALPFQLPFFVACPWCNLLSLRLVCNGTIRFPSKNYYLLWLVESMNGCRTEPRSDNKRVNLGDRDMRKTPNVTRGYLRTWRLHDSLCKSMAFVGHLVMGKSPLVVIFMSMVALYAVPVSVAVLGVCFFVMFALFVSSFLVIYFAFPRLSWLIREIAA